MANQETLQLEAQVLEKKLALVKAEQEAALAQNAAYQDVQLMIARQEASFKLTPVGQELQRFQINQRMGQMYASSTIVPDTYKGNVANCAIAISIALRLNIDAMMVMQNLYVVHGNPAWSSKFLIATINTCGRFQPLRYECNNLEGDAYGWRCYTYDIHDTERKEPLHGSWVTWSTVKAEGWKDKKGSKWLTMPEQMFRYRAAAFWQRQYAPEISMGFRTVEEENDITDVDYVELTPKPAQATANEAPRKSIRAMAAQLAKQQVVQAEQPQVEQQAEQPAEQPEQPEQPEQQQPTVDTESGEIRTAQEDTLFS